VCVSLVHTHSNGLDRVIIYMVHTHALTTLKYSLRHYLYMYYCCDTHAQMLHANRDKHKYTSTIKHTDTCMYAHAKVYKGSSGHVKHNYCNLMNKHCITCAALRQILLGQDYYYLQEASSRTHNFTIPLRKTSICFPDFTFPRSPFKTAG